MAFWPSGLVTATSTAPAACDGVVAVMLEALATFTEVAATPPKLTVAPDTKFVPLMVTEVPPLLAPLLGDIEVIVGGSAPAVVNVKPPARVPAWPSGLVTMTSTVPAACAGA